MSIEYWLLVNLALDVLLLTAVSRWLGFFNWRRVLAAGCACAAYGALAVAHPRPWSNFPVQLLMLVCVSLLLSASTDGRLWQPVALGLCVAALVCAGVSRMLGLRGPGRALAGILLGLTLLGLLFSARVPATASWQVRLCLSSGGRRIRFQALIDTGNRLTEPISGQPVLIAEADLLEAILPDSGFRPLRFGALGGGGSMQCFKPREIWIEHGLRRSRGPEVWVAIAPGALPGSARALAPPIFAYYT